MKKFLFVIPQSPKRIIGPFRQRLIDQSYRSLLAQTSNDWQALFLGEDERTEGNCHYIKSPFGTKEEKLHFVVDLLLAEQNLPEYIIRFDDDDLIHPDVLTSISNLQFDCYADLWHTFFDVSSGRCSSQKRDWLPNTVVHKTEHALESYGEYHYVVKSDLRGPHLLQNDHSKWWHNYYKDKNVVYAPKGQPLYMRVLSPTSYTAGSVGAGDEKKNYAEYLSKFGNWADEVPLSYSKYTQKLLADWEELNGPLWKIDKIRSNSFFSRLGNIFRK